MAKRTDFSLFLGEDRQLSFTILSASGDTAEDVTGWGCSFMVKRGLEDLDGDALITNTSGVVSGVYNSDPDVNTQRFVVTLADTDTDTLSPGAVHWELKRTTAGYETPLAYGTLTLKRGVHRG